jgi:hypothetical protein
MSGISKRKEPGDTTSIVVKDTSLAEILSDFNTTEQMYLLALLRGYSEQEARDMAKGLGTNIDRCLIDPHFAEMRQYFLDNGWRRKSEIDSMWRELLTSHYIELIIQAGIREIGKEDRDNILLKEATKCAIAQRNKGQATTIAQSYDEMVLKRHRVVE